ncbi:ABC transporter permease [Alcaligenaceae bacterium]|nr:ABC transporter permease [Alcaligenaceae bacterium]
MNTNSTTNFLVLAASGDALVAQGDWIIANYQMISRQIQMLSSVASQASQLTGHIDLQGITALDTAGAERLCTLLGAVNVQAAARANTGLSPERSALLLSVAQAMQDADQPVPIKQQSVVTDLLARIGLSTITLWKQTIELLGFAGLVLEALVRNVLRPSQWRPTAIVAQIEETTLNAVPIIALLTFLVGAVVAFLGATILADFGASIYTVNLVGFSFLREFAVLLTAILMAGRTASAFTAQLGSMKANEEIDAIRVQGLDPIVLLVLPRVFAMLLAMPILTFIGMLSGIFGGLLVCALSLGISPTMFFTIFGESIDISQFFIGMSKAPVFAFLIAIIGCLEGFKVSGSAQSVGEHTTSAVVHSIFVVILLDAMAALFFMEMGW